MNQLNGYVTRTSLWRWLAVVLIAGVIVTLPFADAAAATARTTTAEVSTSSPQLVTVGMHAGDQEVGLVAPETCGRCVPIPSFPDTTIQARYAEASPRVAILPEMHAVTAARAGLRDRARWWHGVSNVAPPDAPPPRA